MKTKSITDKILRRMRNHGRGWVFTPADFLDLGTRAAVDQSLKRLVDEDNSVRRLRRGIYDYPRHHSVLGNLPPYVHAIADAVARANDSRLLVTGAKAANALGLTMQVPAKHVYLTDGSARTVKVGNINIQFRHASPAVMRWAGRPGADVLQALRWFGADGIDDDIIQRLTTKLPDNVKHDLDDIARKQLVPAWMQPAIQRLAS